MTHLEISQRIHELEDGLRYQALAQDQVKALRAQLAELTALELELKALLKAQSEQSQTSTLPESLGQGWTETLQQLKAPEELGLVFNRILNAQQGARILEGYSPADGWGECYSYFEAISEQLEAMTSIMRQVKRDPQYLTTALEALRLRVASRELHRSVT